MLSQIMNPGASSSEGNLQDLLEANVVFSLAHKFEHIVCGILADDDLRHANILEDLPDKCPLANTPDVGKSNKRNITPDLAACVFNTALPEQRAKKARTSISSEPPRPSCMLPTADDPIDESFLAKLYSKRDKGRINPAHIVIRRSVLDVRRTMSGRIFLQCSCCKHLPRWERARLSTLVPQSVEGLYRSIVRFMMTHVTACEQMPQKIKDLSPKTSRLVHRGTKNYWIKSAKKKGLMNGNDGKSIVYYCLPANT